MNKKLTQGDFFYCYNYKLAFFLKDRGFEYLVKAINPKTNKIFSMFQMVDGMQEAIDEYKAFK
ncbi:hypothetical protein CD798_08020 [Bacillaceae bacterium SAOS 7]|nr:hypothetical protein CD798_08020 [Bacillaceae bacterium SAOS 7]